MCSLLIMSFRIGRRIKYRSRGRKAFGDEKLPENQYVFSPNIDDSLPKPFLTPQPIYFYDLDNDEVLEIITLRYATLE